MIDLERQKRIGIRQAKKTIANIYKRRKNGDKRPDDQDKIAEIFKWNEYHIPLKTILALAPYTPLFGHPSGKQQKTHWVTFMKLDHNKKEISGADL